MLRCSVRARTYYDLDSSAGEASAAWLLKGGITHRVVMLLALIKPGVLLVLMSGATEALDAPFPLSFPGWRFVLLALPRVSER